ncbi:DUF6301 family protein [Nocardia sp. NPDC003726]
MAPDDVAGRAAVHAAFSDIAAALTALLGAPTAEIVDSIPEIRWTGEETTLLLTDLGSDAIARSGSVDLRGALEAAGIRLRPKSRHRQDTQNMGNCLVVVDDYSI